MFDMRPCHNDPDLRSLEFLLRLCLAVELMPIIIIAGIWSVDWIYCQHDNDCCISVGNIGIQWLAAGDVAIRMLPNHYRFTWFPVENATC